MPLLFLLFSFLPSVTFAAIGCEWVEPAVVIKTDIGKFASKKSCSNASYCTGIIYCPPVTGLGEEKKVICPAMTNGDCPARYCDDNDLSASLELPANAATIQVYQPPRRARGGTAR